MNAKRFFLASSTLGLLMAAVLMLPSVSFAQSKKDVRKAKELADQAAVALRKRDFRNAADGYAKAIGLDPNKPEYYFWKGVAHSDLNEYDLAIQSLDQAAAKNFKPARDIYVYRWRMHLARKDNDAALADVRRGLEADPNNLDFLQAVGDISYAKGDYPSAIDAYQKVLLKKPNSGDLYILIARGYRSMGNVEGQIGAALEAVKRPTPSLGDAYLLLGDGYQKQRKYDEAIDAYQRAIAARPNQLEVYQNLANLYRAQNRFNDAITILRRALQTSPNDGRIYASLSALYSLADRNEEAVQAAQAGIRFTPDEHQAYTNLCRAYNDVNKPEMAIRECNNALRRSPDDGETYFYLGRAHDLAGKANEATQYYKKAVVGLMEFTRKNPESSHGFYLLGNAYFADGQREKAIEAYEKSLSFSPRFVKARYNLAIIQLRQKNKTAALEQYNRILELDPELAGKLKAEIDRS